MNDLVERLRAALTGRYEPVREVGHGGMAFVILARDLRHERDVAIKVLRPELAAGLGPGRFLREIQIEARLQHPHILPLHDSGEADGLLYYVMPYVEGESLRQRLDRERQLPLGDALQIARQVADALAYAHRQNVVHRDIKPGNILLADGHAIVTDFGVARAITVAGADRLTTSGLAVGTPAYMSPEQVGAEPTIDGRSDLYALGCVLYEMLAGAPPFSGATAQAIAARHLRDTPPSLRVVRPTVPAGVELAVDTALAKVPADRFPSVTAFVQALESGATGRPEVRGARRRRQMALGVGMALVAAAFGAWRVIARSSPALDPHRIAVFALEDRAARPEERAGDAVATYIGYALEASEPLRWIEGGDLPMARPGGDRGVAPAKAARDVSRQLRAAFYIDGLILRSPDSVRVILRLQDVAGDSLLARAGASGPRDVASLPRLGLQAVSALLPILLAPGRKVDIAALGERRPAAIAQFLQGEREYRQARFTKALEHYAAAAAADSAFALAALKGSQAAGWLGRDLEQERLLHIAVANQSLLPARYQDLARGQRAYTLGEADSAVAHLMRALTLDPEWSEAWMALGETYYHLLPRAAPLDSLADDAFHRARAADSDFSPPLFHLAEIALRRGQIAVAERLMSDFRQSDPDSARTIQLELMLGCVRGGAAPDLWTRAARIATAATLEAAKSLSSAAAQPHCAEQGFEAVFAADSAPENLRWGALLGLQCMLLAQGRDVEAIRLLEAGQSAGFSGHLLYLLDAATGAPLHDRAEGVASQQGTRYDTLSAPMLWLLGTWETSQGRVSRLAAIAHALEAKVDSSAPRRDRLLVAAMRARLTLLRGDTVRAMRSLDSLTPSAPRAELAWQPWESLGAERLMLAELLLRAGRYSESLRVASAFDSPQPVISLLYLPASLRVRERAADALRRPELASRFRDRLRLLHASAESSPVSAGQRTSGG